MYLFTLICAIIITVILIYFTPKHVNVSNINSKRVSRLRDILKCSDKLTEFAITQPGIYVVFNNFIRASRHFSCEQSISLTTHSDISYLHNLIPLLKSWQGPISVAIYAPKDDFFTALKLISYYRNCVKDKEFVKEVVSFHLFFEQDNFPGISFENQTLVSSYSDEFDCKNKPDTKDSYKSNNKLSYPINVARNIARENAETHFILPLDITLMPTPGFISNFLKMIKLSPQYAKQRRVFVLPSFEISENVPIPSNKTMLQILVKEKMAQVLQTNFCKYCHNVINSEEWIKTEERAGLSVFSNGKRHGEYIYWEPFFVGTNDDPFFDDKMMWEGGKHKLSQAYALCILDYDFLVLDNAFLVQRGLSKIKKQQPHRLVVLTNLARLKSTRKALIELLGYNEKCEISPDI